METLVFILITLLKQPKSSYVAPTVYQQVADADVMAKIANASGYVAGQPSRDPIGTVYEVNDSICK